MEAEQEITRELTAKESLIWAGRPRQGIVFRSSDVLLIPFSLFWGGFAIYWEAGVLSSDSPLFFRLWGIPFVLVGFYLVAGRFFFESYQRGKTFYGLTSDRVIIVSGMSTRIVKSLNLRTLTDISVTERSDRSGTITFGQTGAIHSLLGNSSWPGAGQGVPCFDLIPNAKEVYEKIRSARNKGT